MPPMSASSLQSHSSNDIDHSDKSYQPDVYRQFSEPIHLRPASSLRTRQAYPQSGPPMLNLPVADSTAAADDDYTPYTPTIPLHANIVPTSIMSPHVSAWHKSPTPPGEIVLVIAGAIAAVIMGFMGFFVLRSYLPKKRQRPFRLFICCRRSRKSDSKADATDKGALILANDYDDSTWGTPTRLVYVPRHDDSIYDHVLQDPEFEDISLNPEKPPAIRPTSTRSDVVECCGSTVEDSDTEEKELFQCRVRDEEQEISLALSAALRDAGSEQHEEDPSTNSGRDPFSLMGYEANVSIFKSLQASIDSLARGIASPGRPRQGSDASSSSQVTTSPDIMECFSVASSSRSSMTSLASSDEGIDGEECDVDYEVKRAHTQSLEIKKGVLIAWQYSNSSSSITDVDRPILDMPPTVVVSEPSPTLSSLDRESPNTIYSVEASLSRASLSTASHDDDSETTPSLSSLIRENSRGTIHSLATSFSTATRTDGWCNDDPGLLQPQIPRLIVTHPSSSSIYTLASATSSVSVDLNDFPLPPVPIKTSFSKLFDQVPSQKRVWDNHPVNSSFAQRRSTVERFIMMYSNA
ncbi:hypothetical protein Hypma_002671 [Hypsizygus marmoreus]|uniref:Uncharacterized protein n=1 Tax=Hypsizygus marmoreus TaxID=39966 RepID=A0A369J753_HYPMA|nr:hypothetical protein Hypma_002671 [Hypsizygus marmoreus]